MSRKPGWVFWASVVVAELVGYPLSWGPITWLRTLHYLPYWARQAIVVPYRPLIMLSKTNPTLDVSFRRYSARWYPKDYPPCFLPYIEPAESTANRPQALPTFCVVGIASTGEQDVVVAGLTLELAEVAAEYIVRTNLRDDALVEPE